jgi:GxxExxY protein
MVTKKYLDELTYKILGWGIEVHKQLGHGLLESVYQKCFNHELFVKPLHFASRICTPINYKGIILEADLRLDVLVEDIIIVQLKANGRDLACSSGAATHLYEIIKETERDSHQFQLHKYF